MVIRQRVGVRVWVGAWGCIAVVGLIAKRLAVVIWNTTDPAIHIHVNSSRVQLTILFTSVLMAVELHHIWVAVFHTT